MSGDLPDRSAQLVRVYAVRLAESRQAIGIFAAIGINQLADLVLEYADSTTTEYLALGPGGLGVAQPGKAEWPPQERRDAQGELSDFLPEDEHPLKAAVLDECWWRAIYQGVWHPLDWDPFRSDRADMPP